MIDPLIKLLTQPLNHFWSLITLGSPPPLYHNHCIPNRLWALTRSIQLRYVYSKFVEKSHKITTHPFLEIIIIRNNNPRAAVSPINQRPTIE